MEGMEVKFFFIFFGLEVICKGYLDYLYMVIVGNFVFMLKVFIMFVGLFGFEVLVLYMMKWEMDKLDILFVFEFFEIIEVSGGEVYVCKLVVDMFYLK